MKRQFVSPAISRLEMEVASPILEASVAPFKVKSEVVANPFTDEAPFIVTMDNDWED